MDNKIDTGVGQRLREIRQKKGISIEDMAKGLNCSTNHLEALENGTEEIEIPHFFTLFNTYGIDTNYLLTGYGNITDSKKKELLSLLQVPAVLNDIRAHLAALKKKGALPTVL
ncbi:MAG: helix-turn-helix transcriptional regulator [bacterium]|nr:helix-turn-helix transcriptional regulator [bacterium]